MTRSLKKVKEFNILRSVYSNSLYPSVEAYERPDFIVKSAVEFFGVEVTEFYIDETSARLQNRPGYAEEIINAEYIHKEDAKHVEVVRLSVMRKGTWKPVPGRHGVKQQNPPITDVIALLVKSINKKSELFHQYDKRLSNIDLIVNERRGALLDGIHNTFVRQAFYTMKGRSLLRSGFRNIFVVVQVDRGNSNEVFQLK